MRGAAVKPFPAPPHSASIPRHVLVSALPRPMMLPTTPRALRMVWSHLVRVWVAHPHGVGCTGLGRGCHSAWCWTRRFTCSVLPIGQVWGDDHAPPLAHADPLQALVHAGDDVALPDVGVVRVVAGVAAGTAAEPGVNPSPAPTPLGPASAPLPRSQTLRSKQGLSFAACFVPVPTLSSASSINSPASPCC